MFGEQRLTLYTVYLTSAEVDMNANSFSTPVAETQPMASVSSGNVCASFPSPAADYSSRPLDLNEYCIKKPSATFFVRVQGDSMIGAGIHNNDLLVVDKSLPAIHRRIVVAVIDGDFTVKRLDLTDIERPVLLAENPDYPDIHLKDGSELEVFGVVRSVIHSLMDL